MGDLVLQEHPEPLFDLFKTLPLFHGDRADAVRPEKHRWGISGMMFCTQSVVLLAHWLQVLCSSGLEGFKRSRVQATQTYKRIHTAFPRNDQTDSGPAPHNATKR